jgi:SAM-dependent methyltransferase
MKPQFDRYAQDYDLLLDDAISVSGETKDYFARARISLLSKGFGSVAIRVESVLDFGCGIGSATPHFFECLPVKRVLGVDLSGEMIDTANRIYGSDRAKFISLAEYQPREEFDLVFCNGVFHHIPKAERAAALNVIRRSLQAQGVFSFWENNPWNPGARYIMKKCAFDKDAETISPPKARRMLTRAGFHIINTRYHFVFPRVLRALRATEPLLAALPIGAQYHVLSRIENKGT